MDDRIGWMPIEKFKFDQSTSRLFCKCNWLYTEIIRRLSYSFCTW